jgi:hypothetical protein
MAFFECLNEERQLSNCEKVGSHRFTNALGYVAERYANSGKVADPARRGDLPRGALHYLYLLCCLLLLMLLYCYPNVFLRPSTLPG